MTYGFDQVESWPPGSYQGGTQCCTLYECGKNDRER
jgi:hypothetical protein